jgi:hypothetical protein
MLERRGVCRGGIPAVGGEVLTTAQRGVDVQPGPRSRSDGRVEYNAELRHASPATVDSGP